MTHSNPQFSDPRDPEVRLRAIAENLNLPDPEVLSVRMGSLNRGAHEGSWQPTGFWLLAQLLIHQSEQLADVLDALEETEALVSGLNERFVERQEDVQNG